MRYFLLLALFVPTLAWADASLVNVSCVGGTNGEVTFGGYLLADNVAFQPDGGFTVSGREVAFSHALRSDLNCRSTYWVHVNGHEESRNRGWNVMVATKAPMQTFASCYRGSVIKTYDNYAAWAQANFSSFVSSDGVGTVSSRECIIDQFE